MCSLETFRVNLKGLQEGISTRTFHLSDDFFAALQGAEVSQGDLVCTLTVDRRGDLFQLQFHTEGVVHVACDICLDDMEQPISTDEQLTARLGEEYAEDGDFITVAEADGTLDISWLVYEQVWLAIPLRHVHASGLCNEDMLRILRQHTAQPEAKSETRGENPWRPLMQLKEKIQNNTEQ